MKDYRVFTFNVFDFVFVLSFKFKILLPNVNIILPALSFYNDLQNNKSNNRITEYCLRLLSDYFSV